MKYYLALFCVLAFFDLSAQTNSFFVAPSQTNTDYEIDQDSHQVVFNLDESNEKLFIFFGGTGSNTNSYRTISRFAGGLGYHVLNLSYPNAVPAAFFANNPDSLSFRKFRQEVCYGTPLSGAVQVDSLNSLHTRIINLLNYLDTEFPNQEWDSFLLNSSSLDWSKIAIGGHSQGSGHAAYFAKQELVDRVLMFSGPNDFSNFYLSSAEWLREEGATPTDRYFAYLSLLDEVVDFEKQLANIQGLGIFPVYDTVHVDVVDAPYRDSRSLYTTQPPGIAILNHNTTVRLSILNNAVWTYMLETPLFTNVSSSPITNNLKVYPNPSASIFKIEKARSSNLNKVQVFDAQGKSVSFNISYLVDGVIIDLGTQPQGLYIVQIGDQSVKVVKL